jgi:hypothetical protein
MNRWMTRICGAGLLASMSLGLGSCASNDDMLVIIGAMFAQPPDCSYLPSATSQLLLSGIVDLGFGTNYGGSYGANYTAVLLVSNQLASRGSKARLRAETSNVTINNAEVRLLQNGTNELGYFSVPASGYIAVGSGEDSGFGAISIDVLPGSIKVPGTPATGFIIAEIRLQGTTLGGASIESNLFRFEIFVVDSSVPGGNGLVYYPALSSAGLCDSNVCTTTTRTATACYPGQDSYISCCDCSKPFCQTPP